MTWYVARGGVAVTTDTSDPYGVSAAIGFGELCEAVSIDGELVVADPAVGVPVAAGLAELSEAVSIGGELLVADPVVVVSLAVGLADLCKAISTGGELLVADPAVAAVGDAATDGVFG